MENMGKVSNFLEIGKKMFGDVNIKYEVKNNYEDPDPAELVYTLKRIIDKVTYTAEKWYEMFITSHGILISSPEGDYYFEKDNFQSNISTLEDVIS